MFNVLRWLGRVILIALTIAILMSGCTYLFVHETAPSGQSPSKADQKAHTLLEAINYKAWDSTAYIRWTFTGGHHYIWDKKRNWIEIQWENNRVLLRLNEGPRGVAFTQGEPDPIQDSAKAQQKINTAWSYFCNDEFWLNGPAKIFDPGTKRSIVPQDNQRDGLLVHYTQGGVTPGDKYMWIQDSTGKPKKCKMWVSIIPIGGVTATWEEWQQLSTGAWIASQHQMLFFTINITNLKGGMELTDVTERPDVFQPLKDTSQLHSVTSS